MGFGSSGDNSGAMADSEKMALMMQQQDFQFQQDEENRMQQQQQISQQQQEQQTQAQLDQANKQQAAAAATANSQNVAPAASQDAINAYQVASLAKTGNPYTVGLPGFSTLDNQDALAASNRSKPTGPAGQGNTITTMAGIGPKFGGG